MLLPAISVCTGSYMCVSNVAQHGYILYHYISSILNKTREAQVSETEMLLLPDPEPFVNVPTKSHVVCQTFVDIIP